MLDTSTIRIDDMGAGRTNGWLTIWIDALRKHIEVGELSAAEAAGELNCEFRTAFTRNAVIGQCKRSQIKMAGGKGGRKGPKGGPSTAKKRVKTGRPITVKADPPPQKLPEPAPYVPAIDTTVSRRVSLLELTDFTCRWPIGMPNAAGFCFCGNPPLEGVPYCIGHSRLAFRAPEPRRSQR